MVLWLVPSWPTLRTRPVCKFVTGNELSGNCRRIVRWKCTRRPEILPCVSKERTGLRVFVLSDLHTDYAENMMWVNHISMVTHKKDILLVAGDVAETFKNFVQTMSLLKDRFEHVFYVPGNHDLWCRWEKEKYVRNTILGMHFRITCDTDYSMITCIVNISFPRLDLEVNKILSILSDKLMFNCLRQLRYIII